MESEDIEPDEWIEQQRIFVAKAEIDVAALGRSSTDFGQASRYFDWQRYCYKYISKEKRAEAEGMLKKFIHEDAEWTARIKKRGRIFFQFIQAWVKLV